MQVALADTTIVNLFGGIITAHLKVPDNTEDIKKHVTYMQASVGQG